MTVVLYRGREYFRTQDVCRMTGISRSTLLRWIRSGTVKQGYLRDRRGWRLYSREDIDHIALVAGQVSPEMEWNGDDKE